MGPPHTVHSPGCGQSRAEQNFWGHLKPRPLTQGQNKSQLRQILVVFSFSFHKLFAPPDLMSHCLSLCAGSPYRDCSPQGCPGCRGRHRSGWVLPSHCCGHALHKSSSVNRGKQPHGLFWTWLSRVSRASAPASAQVPQVRAALLQLPSLSLWVSGDQAMAACPFPHPGWCHQQRSGSRAPPALSLEEECGSCLIAPSGMRELLC